MWEWGCQTLDIVSQKGDLNIFLSGMKLEKAMHAKQILFLFESHRHKGGNSTIKKERSAER